MSTLLEISRPVVGQTKNRILIFASCRFNLLIFGSRESRVPINGFKRLTRRERSHWNSLAVMVLLRQSAEMADDFPAG
jgi:hypothetical protein